MFSIKQRLRFAVALIVVTMAAPLIHPSVSAIAASTSKLVMTNCVGDQLEVGLAFGPGATGHGSDIVLITNVGKKSCRLEGFPRLRFSTATSAVSVAISHSTYMFKDLRPSSVRLSPERIASFGIGYGDMYSPKSDAPGKCLVTTTSVLLGALTYEIPFSLDVCRSDMALGVTAIQSGAYPTPFNAR